MKIYSNLDEPLLIHNAVATIGSFDGVHKGHQQIFSRLKTLANEIQGESLVITFWPHPRFVLKTSSNPLKLIHTFEEKMKLFSQYGIDHVLKIPFTKALSELSSEKFVKDILIDKVNIKKLVIGYDHRFGNDRRGDIHQLRKEGVNYNFLVEEIPRRDIDHIAIGSSRIRDELTKGNIEEAEHLLGHPYSFSGKVIKGNKVGRNLGFPTANLDVLFSYKIIPSEGIYAVLITHQQSSYGGMLYIGNRPTINGTSQSIEVNIFDFNMTIYEKYITVRLVSLIRKDIKFNDMASLKTQLLRDKQCSLSILTKKALL